MDSTFYDPHLMTKYTHVAILLKKELNIEIGKLEHLKDFDLSDPLVKRMMKKRYGKNIPYNELVISPKSMFEADNLSTIVVYK